MNNLWIQRKWFCQRYHPHAHRCEIQLQRRLLNSAVCAFDVEHHLCLTKLHTVKRSQLCVPTTSHSPTSVPAFLFVVDSTSHSEEKPSELCSNIYQPLHTACSITCLPFTQTWLEKLGCRGYSEVSPNFLISTNRVWGPNPSTYMCHIAMFVVLLHTCVISSVFRHHLCTAVWYGKLDRATTPVQSGIYARTTHAEPCMFHSVLTMHWLQSSSWIFCATWCRVIWLHQLSVSAELCVIYYPAPLEEEEQKWQELWQEKSKFLGEVKASM